MSRSRLWLLAPVALLMAASSAPAMAADPTVREVYAAARAGQVDKAIDMMNIVLKDHPGSAKAHYVQAELLAKQARYAEARGELANAEKLDPALKGIQPQSVSALKEQLNGGASTRPVAPVAAPARGFPWGMALIVGAAVFALLALFRGRRRQEAYQPPMGGGYNPANGYGPNGYGPQGGYPQQQGGFGSGLMGNLAAGAAAGVGFAAGERIIDGMFGDHDRGGQETRRESAWDAGDSNQDMGGNDFGLSDSSWDSGDSGGDGGDW